MGTGLWLNKNAKLYIMQYNIKITGTGSLEQIAGSLRLLEMAIQKGNIVEEADWNDENLSAEIKETKSFLWVDKSGSGRPPIPHTYESLVLVNDKEEPSNLNYDGLVLSEWVEEAEVGEEWENAAEKYIRVE